MSRTRRASTGAVFTYLQFALSIVVGIVIIPFVIGRVGSGLYGYWLASGEVLAYAGMSDLGMLMVVPWMTAQAEGQGDRQKMRRLVSAAFLMGVVAAGLYLLLVVLFWWLAPVVLRLPATERTLIAGPLAVLACATALTLPLRVAHSVLMGLQDVTFQGAMATIARALEAAIVVTLLWNGHGLYALAFASAIPPAVVMIASLVRLRAIAPDLLARWERPTARDVVLLCREGFGTWLGNLGWRLSVATDAIVIAALGQPVWITMLALTTKLANMLMQMAWVPGDNGLVGLAQLHGEGKPERLRAAVAALFRLNLGLVSAGACIVLAANPAFVHGWVGADFFAGFPVNAMLAAAMVITTAGHGVAAVSSVLGERLRAGWATALVGIVQVPLALYFGRRLGLVGVPLASVLAQALLIPLLLPSLHRVGGITGRQLAADVVRAWILRSVLPIMACAAAGPLVWALPIWAAVALGGAIGLAVIWLVRPMVFGYPPVADLVRRRLVALGGGRLMAGLGIGTRVS